MAPTNTEIIAAAHDQELEGEESAALAQQVVDFVAAKQTAHDDALAAAQATIDQLTADALPADQREEITQALTNAKSSFDGVQAVLTALVTPPEEPLPEPIG
jgi:hypothetical protein